MRGNRGGILALAVLAGINLLNYLDRYVVSALLPEFKRAPMHLNDFELGTLMSGFLIVYMLAAPVFGRLGDRGSRPRPIAIGVFLWSLATGLSGLARNYAQLLAARAVVGIGEAAYGTIAPSLLADFFARRTRGRAFAIFNMAIPVGAALGYIVGGVMRERFSWHAAFYVAGIPGVFLALWILRLPDPPRGAQEESDGAASAMPPVHARQAGSWEVYLRLLRQRPYLLTVLGYAAYTFALGGLAFWMPTFLERVRGIPAVKASAGFGEIVVLTGFIGTFAGGWLGDYWLQFSRQAYLWMSGWITLLAVPAVYLALGAGAPAVFYPALVVAELLLFMSTGPINTAIVNLVSPAERASAVALSILAIHLLGDVLSPSIIGALSVLSSLGAAVMIVPGAVAICAALWLWAARADAAPADTI
ncbi:MAG: MFS transporter [Gammaproteobacteria bacterium]|nr:MFS transporter [Gammaproteobacteria bacterium]MDE2262893.1 MFS transporter [Gammaproteobacteria bacterium]